MYAVWTAKPITSVRFGSRPHPWVARLTGFDGLEFEREFVKAVRDYSHASRSGRGVILYFNLAPGLYEFYRPTSWQHEERFCGRVEDGEIIRMRKEEVMACLLKNT